MDIKPIIVREYLESLKESEELDYIFSLFLESQGFVLLSKPTESKGISQYGKDVVAVGNDFNDGVKKRFYFELKGGDDRHITNSTFVKNDGIKESLIEAKYRKFEFTNKDHEALPLKIVLVHNGELKASVKDVFEGFINTEFPATGNIEFDKWGISELTGLFSEKFFGEFLLANKEATKLFNKTIVNLDVEDKISKNYIELLDLIFVDIKKEEYNKSLPRKWKMFFESLRLVMFVIYTQSKEYNNLNIAKKYLTYSVVRIWYWVLKNKFEQDKNIGGYIDKILDFYIHVMTEYFHRTISIACIDNGLYSEVGGRYEQIGYTLRTLEYLKYLCWYIKLSPTIDDLKKLSKECLIPVINSNNVSARPLLDIHSTPIIDVLKILIETGDIESAKTYLLEVLFYIKLGKEKYNRLPDANNSENNVIKFIVTKEKPIYYSDSTSPLLAVLMEFIVILDMKDEFYEMRDFIIDQKIDLGLFIPHHGINSTSKHFIEDKENDLEEQLFSNPFFNDGYQRDTWLHKNLNEKLSYEEFKKKIIERKDEFKYEYRTKNAGYSLLIDLAHIYNRIPYFPDKWSYLLQEN